MAPRYHARDFLLAWAQLNAHIDKRHAHKEIARVVEIEIQYNLFGRAFKPLRMQSAHIVPQRTHEALCFTAFWCQGSA
jgi:hypothetical protein